MMIKAWIVMRHYHVIDDKYWVCLSQEDAYKIAHDIIDYWTIETDDEGNPWHYPVTTDEHKDGNGFHCYQEENFWVTVQLQQIREVGEINNDTGED